VSKTSANAAVLDRRRLVRRFLVEGTARSAVVAHLVRGVKLDDGRTIRVSESTARRDVAAVAEEFVGLFEDADMVALEVGSAAERIKEDARKLRQGHKYAQAARIELLYVRLITAQRPEWAALHGGKTAANVTVGGVTVGVAAGHPAPASGSAEEDDWLRQRAAELASKSPAELRSHVEVLRGRVAHLTVHEGGAAPAAQEAARAAAEG